ncbi:3-phosphoshikimate 1-carboxyvinyltransferase [Beduini massiliensis]|uniref:3-phosphoshikimate 1-carboxyvinyltransferase n=1 Tax=Beduini massiliensis TaxID=1585974 RepID=UPI00059AB601|nr:3-phosphoshikimate 1-carboxyvinyltransferase [Beduini massiliensis]
MSQIKLIPTHLNGTVAIPPSKSMAHRAIICAALAKGKSRIDHIEYSQDILATMEAMKALGAHIEAYEDYLLIDGTSTGTSRQCEIDCKESGSTLRFMVPVSLIHENHVRFIGEGNLGKRPLNVFYDIFDEQGITYQYQKETLDLKIRGQLKAGEFKVPGNVSSQFISGLLFALPLLEGDSKIIITSSLESIGYIDLTLQMLETFGIRVVNHHYQEFHIAGRQRYQAHDYYVEADYSQAAFYLVAGALGNSVALKGLNLDSLQGDKEALDILERMGAKVTQANDLIMVEAKSLKATTIDGSQCPDVIPVLALAASLAEGTTKIEHAERLRIKECDRLAAVASELSKLGAKMTETKDGLIIEGVSQLQGGQVSAWADHRIAMTLAIASTCAQTDIIIDNKECVKKSYPSFWQDFKQLGGMTNEC